MPPGLWRRVTQRFAPARVLEFYASPHTEAILVNLSGEVPLAGGRPLPGSAEVRIAAWDLEAGRLDTGDDGFAQECGPGQTGMLLARAQIGDASGGDAPLRGVFSRDDAWASTGDLFRADDRGALWLVDAVSALVHTADGVVAPSAVRLALEGLDAVDVAVAFGIPGRKRGVDKLAAAVVPHPGETVSPADLTSAVASLPAAQRPDEILLTPELPVTTWYRPRTGALRERLAKRTLSDGEERLVWDKRRTAFRRATSKGS
jgi:putative long chain acyl-CoA synthase